MPLFPLRRIPVSLAKGSLLARFPPKSICPPACSRFYYGYISDSKMAPQLEPFFKQLSPPSPLGLRKAVAIPSISAQDENRKDVFRMGQFLASELEALGAEVHQQPLGKQPGKEHLDLPPVVIARYGNDKNKRTILVYGHYDVQPALKEDGWATEPFELNIDEKGRMYGRGSTDDKGPVLGWINVIEAHRKAGVELPVNLLCCFEGMEEYGSEGLDEFIEAESKKFFKDADAVCISDNYWLGTEKPCLTYGLRGCNYYSISVSGPAQDLHSGVFGGSAHEPMTDLVNVLSKLVDSQGNILIPGIMDLVEPLTEEEKSLYGNISYTMDNLHESLGSETGIHPTKERTLMARWRYPSLSIHGVEGAYSAPGAKTVIPAKVVGKFSIRTVPNMESPDVNKLVFDYIKAEFAKLNSKNTLDVWLQHDGKWWVASPKHWNFTAASKAVEQVFGVEPDMTREGGRYVGIHLLIFFPLSLTLSAFLPEHLPANGIDSIPVTLTFEQATGKNVLLLPMGSSTDAAHSINEKLDRRNYIEGIKLLGAYLHYVAEEPITA
ncbi:Zn-dependent exopeptidase [Penicillium alfredii]|uniref:Zn-dependent exopeptidase n=1 Tax=Penicillium alfredii TaxID=1506179 RepID=A0A9W9KR01_9EURO|nr:Zn-dependent exopeptidase [Penicillium alfredii]KAJ5114598.1 Zn-dependent exopeptidase [Penicillium alfredii]